MNKIVKVLSVVVILVISSCSSTQSLQEYFVDNSENPNFLSVDLPVSLLNMDKVELSEAEREALNSLKKMNVLAFKKSDTNSVEFEEEKTNVKAILKNEKFIDLMKLNTSYGKGVIKYIGNEEEIDEVIIYGDNDEKGFMLIRVLGNNMKPANLVQFMQAVQKSDYKGEGLSDIADFIKG
ncbi:DUF4252 domain-containing protein [Maribacter sp. TH_r10]|uniref:DUF4252 domain-containing protein n=1 Tax=Maribacter luteus TaxID=2594478 RepID=A0A6I2MTW3_9FLAO|nr:MULTISPECIES: DUF4252 domain-containing protein [Maribacter]MDV7138543.1 DUF4252 domain-containing protein [Maribacter sp. TH_r10]MRX66085.1 DUF4252 domain-containing protein [Maribacter luteus]|tara:strand:- start:763 stop:1302 length:540 start_codon:yes stop_codon:yes gene_type:complete